jgi:cytochrome c oxidase assembly protein subunit 15
MSVDLSPIGQVAAIGALVAGSALLWLRWRSRGANVLAALTVLTLFLTFDLILFGAFTRLTDSGLGCPDWPGCYGFASPVGAHGDISTAQAAMPTGPVTHGKAWIEMLHRYLASGVGLLCLVLCGLSWWQHAKRGSKISPVSPYWATLTFVWVCVQGAFGALTVTMKLFPAIVTLHLLLALGLLALLAWQMAAFENKPLALPRSLHRAAWAVFLLALAQIALGGWVSTNYAVLACSEVPTCAAGQWWPDPDFRQGFELWRHLGQTADGGLLPFNALIAIHLAHRIGAGVVTVALLAFTWALRRAGQSPETRIWARRFLLLLIWQIASGLSNVVLGWPLLAALAHTGGAAMLVLLMSLLLARSHRARIAA